MALAKARTPDRGILQDAGARHPDENGMRTGLDEGVAPEVTQRRHTGGKADGLADMTTPVCGSGEIGTRERSRNVGNERDAWLGIRDRRGDSRKVGEHRLDEWRMECVRNTERRDGYAGGAQCRGDTFDGFGAAGED